MLWQLVLGVLFLIIGFFKLLATGLVFSFLMIYLGIQFIFGFAAWPFGNHQCDANSSACTQSVWLGHGHYNLDAATVKTKQLFEYKTVLGTSELDFSSIGSTKEHTQAPVIVNIDTVMGKTVLHLNKEMPVRIIAKAALGKIILPDNTSIAMGSSVYSNKPQEQPLMIIYCSTVFGVIEIQTK